MKKKKNSIVIGFGIIILFLFILLIGLVIKTLIYPFPKRDNVVVEKSAKKWVPSEKAIQRFVGGLRIPTVSVTDTSDTEAYLPFERFKAYLPRVYPRIYHIMDTSVINEYGLVFHWKGKNSSSEPLLFLSHYDVVPVAGYVPGDSDADSSVYNIQDLPSVPITAVAGRWDYSPFSGAVVNGRIYGRGTLDMKGMLFALLEAADTLIAGGYRPERDIWFAFGYDEEIGGTQGARYIADYFKEQNIRFAAVYDEGGIVNTSVPGAEGRPVALVGVGEKGLLTLNIKVYGMGGHSSMPPQKSSLVMAAEVIERLNADQMPARIIPPVASFLTNIGSGQGFIPRMVIANRWLLQPLLLKTLSENPASNALIRTTTAITMAKGSDAPNVLSSMSEITVNFRLLPGDSVEKVIEHVEKLCKGYEVEIEVASAREASGISPENTPGYEAICNAMKTVYPEALVAAYITIGGTDAYKYQIVSDNIYRFMPLALNEYEQRTIHNENEYISLENYGRMIGYFKELISNYGAGSQ